MTIGEKIYYCRTENHMTQKQLAEKCGMADSAIRKYESGKVTPKYETLQKIANALGVSWKELYPTFEEALPTIREKTLSGDATLENISQTLSSPVYLMPENEEEYIKFLQKLNGIEKEVEQKQLLDAFSKLNYMGQHIAIERIEELAQIPKYQRTTDGPQDAPTAPDDKEPTEK